MKGCRARIRERNPTTKVVFCGALVHLALTREGSHEKGYTNRSIGRRSQNEFFVELDIGKDCEKFHNKIGLLIKNLLFNSYKMNLGFKYANAGKEVLEQGWLSHRYSSWQKINQSRYGS